MPVADSGPIEPDTTAEVAAPDTSVRDTDSPVVDSAPDVADVADADAAVPVGSIVVTGTSFTTFPLDLTAEGTRSWAHWGLLGPDSFDRKVGSGELANGANLAPSQYGEFPVAFTWSDGDPTVSVTASKTGIYRNSVGLTLQLNAQADAAERTLRIYVATQAAVAQVYLTLGDGSAAPVVIALPVVGTPPGGVHRPQQIAAVYRATSSTRLNVRIEQQSAGFVSLFAATLQ